MVIWLLRMMGWLQVSEKFMNGLVGVAIASSLLFGRYLLTWVIADGTILSGGQERMERSMSFESGITSTGAYLLAK